MEESPALQVATRVLQMIVSMLLLGVLTFLVVAILIVVGREEPPTDPPMMTGILCGVGLAFVVGVLFVRSAMRTAARRRIAQSRERDGAEGVEGATGRLYAVYQRGTILTAAALEGAALLGLVAAILEGHPLALAYAGFFALLLAFTIPTRARVDRYLEDELLALGWERHR